MLTKISGHPTSNFLHLIRADSSCLIALLNCKEPQVSIRQQLLTSKPEENLRLQELRLPSHHELFGPQLPHPQTGPAAANGVRTYFTITTDHFQSMLGSHQLRGLEAEDITNRRPTVPAQSSNAFKPLKTIIIFSQESTRHRQRPKTPCGGG